MSNVELDAVPERVTIRLDPQTRGEILAVMRESGMNFSQSIRLLIVLGAAREQELETTFKAAAFREVASQACNRIRSRTEAMLTSVLKDLEEESRA